MASFFQRLREKPEPVRRRFALVLSACITVLIVLVLIIAFLYQAAYESRADEPLELPDSQSDSQSAEQDGINSFSEFFSQVKEGWEEQMNSGDDTEVMESATSTTFQASTTGSVIVPYINIAAPTTASTSTSTAATSAISASSTSSSRGNVNGN